MKLLIVDDSEPSRNALGAILGEAGYSDVVLKPSASEAIEFLDSSAGTDVDLILMDVMMPEIDGIEAVRIIKSNEDLRGIPIIMVSARDEEEKIEMAFEAGAIDFIGKPFKKLELRARVRSILKLKEEMDQRRNRETELEETVSELQRAMAEVKQLSGLLPICSKCKNIRDDKGYWMQVEHYITERSDAQFTHGMCPDCIREMWPEVADRVLKEQSQIDPGGSKNSQQYLNSIIEKEWRRATKLGNPLSIIRVKIELPPEFNHHDTRLLRDDYLRIVVEALQRDLKRVGDLLAHLGSDEFVALIPDTDEEGVKELAEVMRNNISDSENDERGLKIDNITKVNMGLCTVVPTKDLAPQMLIEAAGYAIEQAQKQGGNLTIMGTVKQGQHP